MKKGILFLLSLCLMIFSCSDEETVPSITLNQLEIIISNEGGSQTVSFDSNVSWTASSSANWCKVSPASGDASIKSTTITLSDNDTYDARSCTVTIMAGGVSKTLTVNQDSNLGLLVTQDKYDLTNDASIIDVEIKANVDYDVTISDEWITQLTTRGLTTTKLQFNIAKNSSYDNRNGSISIKQKDGTLSSNIKVYQSQEDAIIISNKTEDISNDSQLLEVELKTNVDFEVVIPEAAKSWVTYISTRALRTEIVSLNIKRNNDDEIRSTDIYIKNKETSFQDTLKITQDAKEPNVYWVDKMGTLSTVLNQTQKDTIITMIVRGEINKADFEVMKRLMPKLRYLDLKDVKCDGDKIPNEAFGSRLGILSNKDISTIILPQSIISIGDYAFTDCSGLTGPLNLPSGLTTIGYEAFNACTGFTGPLSLPSGLTVIGSSAFRYCTGLTGTLTLPPRLTTIGASTFYNTHFTGPLILPAGITEIGMSAFAGCSGFTGDLILPVGLKTIKMWAFINCTGFNGSLTLPPGLETIEREAFSGCNGFIGSLNFSDGLNTIGYQTFKDCSGFTGDLILPAGLTTIDYRAFYGCKGFTGLIFPNELTSIGQEAFVGCSGFTGILSLSSELITINQSAFAGTNFTGVVFGTNITTIYENAFRNCGNISGSVVFPARLNSIRNEAFAGCGKVDAFRFPHITPPSHYINMLPNGATVQVPLSAVAAYKSTYGWKDYNIVGY